MRATLLSFVSGGLFALGLTIAGITEPTTLVHAFTFGPGWDPQFYVAFAAALAVHRPLRVGADRVNGLVAPPARTRVDARLLVGAAIFGVGWGVGGICPAVGLTSLASGGSAAPLFAVGFALGMVLGEVTRSYRGRAAPRSGPASFRRSDSGKCSPSDPDRCIG